MQIIVINVEENLRKLKYKMKLKFIFLYLALFLISLNIVNALEIDKFETNIEIYKDGITKVVNELTFDSTGIEELIYIPAYNPESIIIKDNYGDLKYATFSGFITVFPNKKVKNYKIKLQYLTTTLTSKINNKWSIYYEYPSLDALNYKHIKNNHIKIHFPKKTTLMDSTEGNKIFTEDDCLVLEWHPILKEYEVTILESNYGLEAGKPSNIKDYILIISITMLCVVVGIFLFNYISNRYLKKISKEKKNMISMLSDPEKQVVELLLKTKDKKLTQSKIFVQTGISKPTLSRAIKKLERRKIIEIKPVGNTNLIILTKEFCKK